MHEGNCIPIEVHVGIQCYDLGVSPKTLSY